MLFLPVCVVPTTPSLSVDQEEFVGKVLDAVPAGVPSVVLLNTPGTVLTPWADKVGWGAAGDSVMCAV